MKFEELGLNKSILRGLNAQGYENATPIQEQTIQAFSSGKDVVGQSQTGTGKTAAFVLPLLNVVNPKLKKIQAMILAPTRELAWQTQEEFFNLGRWTGIRTLAAYGGKSIRFQKKLIDEKGMNIAVCTPGRAIDLIKRGYIDPSYIKYFVLDEVDRMLDMGFVDDVEWIWKQCPNIEQRMLFSATVTREVKNIISKYLQPDYAFIEIAPEKIVVDRIDHSFTIVSRMEKSDLLVRWLSENKDSKTIVFTQTKRAAADVDRYLQDKGFSSGHLSGDMDQRDRNRTLNAYKADEMRVMVATDVASRGLNMKDINLVINYDVPEDPESYVHRIGRTARAGKSGKALMSVTSEDYGALKLIEKRNKIRIPVKDTDGNPIERPDELVRTRSGKPRYRRRRSGGGKSYHTRRRSSTRQGGRYSASRSNKGQENSYGRSYRDRPTTKEIMSDFIPATKPRRGSYWGKN